MKQLLLSLLPGLNCSKDKSLLPKHEISEPVTLLLTQLQTFYAHEKLNIPEVYSEPSQPSKMELFAKIVNS